MFHIENDMWHMKDGKYAFDCRKQDMAISWCLDMCDRALSEGMDVVVSNTFTKQGYVDAYRKIAEKHGAEFVVYRMRGDFDNVHSVPVSVLDNMRRNFKDWPGELNVYPNLNQDKADPCYRPYIITDKKVGDKVTVRRFKRDTGGVPLKPVGIRTDDAFEMEDCIATVTDIQQGAYDYLNVSYVEDDTGEAGMCMSGDCALAGK